MPKEDRKNKLSYNFVYGQYREDPNWWKSVLLKKTNDDISINELLVRLLDKWLAGEVEI